MEPKRFVCPACKKLKGQEIFMLEEYDMITCPKCQTSFVLDGRSPLGRYEENWKRNAEELFPLVRPPILQSDLPNPRLFFLYEDCYHTLLIGRYNASIVMMGVLLEAIMKERIYQKLQIDFKHPFSACLSLVQRKHLMDQKDIAFLSKFKNHIRNLYQHSDESQILEGIVIPVLPLEFKTGISLEKLNETLEKARKGELKPRLSFASDIPAIRSVVKRKYDRENALALFNRVYDFLLDAKIKYFKQTE